MWSCLNQGVLFAWRIPTMSEWIASHRQQAAAQWFQKGDNSLEISDFTSFYKKVSANSHYFCFRSLHVLCIEKLSNCCRQKYDRPISRIHQINFRRIFEICPNCTTPDKPRGVAPQTGRLLVTALYWLNWLKCGTKISKNFTWKIGIFVTGGDDGAHAICIH